jgi:hypothetical protein
MKMTASEKVWALIGLLVLTLIVGLIFVRVAFFDFVDNYEMAYLFDKRKGEIYVLKDEKGNLKNGYIFSYPFINSVHKIDLRPMQVCINANSRVLNCKLVEFNPKGFDLFIEWHGRADYTAYQLKDIMTSYAYDESSQKYPFLNILKELKNEDYTDNLPNTNIKTNEFTEGVEEDSI